MAEPNLYTIGALVGKLVSNEHAQNLGKVEDLMIDIQGGRALFAVLSFGGLWGLGGKLFAVPWETLGLSEAGAVGTFVLRGVDREAFDRAPHVRHGEWPDVADPAWLQQTTEYWRNWMATHPKH